MEVTVSARSVVRAALLLAFFALSIDSPAQQRQRAIPLKSLAHLSVVEVMIDGKGPFDFIFDTGAGINVLDVDLVAELGLEPVGTMEVGSPMGQAPMIADSLRIESLQLGDAVVKGLPGVALDLGKLLEPLADVDGILSAGSFDGFLVTVDFANKYVLVSAGALPPADGRRVLNYSRDNVVLRVEASVAGVSVVMTIDSGAPSGIMLSDSLVATLPLLAEPVSVAQARSVDATFDIWSSQLDGNVRIGEIEIQRPTFTFSDHAGHALVGMQVLKDYSLTIDSENRRLSFAQAPQVRRAGGVDRQAAPDADSNTGEEYVGQYGNGTITMVGSQLHFKVGQMPTAVPIKMIAADEFEIVIPAGAIVRGGVDGAFPTIRFDRDETGSVNGMTVVNPDGSVRETAAREK